jgi:hypothetical protein
MGIAESEVERLRVAARASIPSLFEDVPV